MAITYLSGERIQGSSAPLGDISKTGLKFYYKFDDSGSATRGKIAGGSQGGYANWGRTAGTVNNGRDNLSYDLGATLNNTQWIMRFKLHIEKYELNSTSGCQVAIGMSDADADTAYETNQDSISFRIQFASGSSQQNFVANNSNGAEMGSNSVVILDWSSSGTIQGKDYWVEIKRTGTTTGTVSIGENNDFTTGRTSVNLSSLSASTTGLRYFVSKVYDGQSNYVDNHIYGDVSEVKIYNNQSSPTTVTYDVEDFMKSTSGWNINGSAIQNIIPQTKDCINSASVVGSSDAVANSTIDLEYKAEGIRGATGKLGSCMSIVSGDAKGQASGTNRTDTNFITQTGAIWTMCFWVKMDSRVGDQAFVTTSDFGIGEDGLMLRMQNSSGGINCNCGGQATGNKVNATSSSALIPNTGNWHFIMAQYSDTTGNLKMSVNNGTVETVATGQNITNTGTPARQLTVGNTPQLDNDMNGDLDELSIWNRILTTAEITAIYNSGTGEVLNTVQATGDPEKDSITNVPVGTRFEETDTRKIYRWGGGGNSLGSDGDVTNQGATLDTSNEKLGTGCLDFDGSNDYINMTSLLTNDAMTTAGTISFWINFDAVGNGKKIWQFGETGGSYGSADTIYVEIESDLPNSKIMMGCQHGSNTESWTIRTPTGLLSTGTWFHVVMTQDGTSPKIYINATDRTIQSTTTDLTKWVSTLTDLNSFDWGRYNHIGSTTGYVDAKFDDIGIWNRALTSSEITSLYNSGTGALCSTIPSGLRAYFNCNSATVTNNIKGWTEKGTA